MDLNLGSHLGVIRIIKLGGLLENDTFENQLLKLG